MRRAFGGAASTLARHWSGWVRLREYWKQQGLIEADLSVKAMVEFASLFLGEGEEDQDEHAGGACSLRGSLNSLKWLAKRTQLPQAVETLNSPEMVGCISECRPCSARKEAPPSSWY